MELRNVFAGSMSPHRSRELDEAGAKMPLCQNLQVLVKQLAAIKVPASCIPPASAGACDQTRPQMPG